MLLPEGDTPPEPFLGHSPPAPLRDHDFAATLDRLPLLPLLAGEAGLLLSLAGAQAKLLVKLVESRPALPLPGQSTTHVVKPEIPRFAGSVANEAGAWDWPLGGTRCCTSGGTPGKREALSSRHSL